MVTQQIYVVLFSRSCQFQVAASNTYSTGQDLSDYSGLLRYSTGQDPGDLLGLLSYSTGQDLGDFLFLPIYCTGHDLGDSNSGLFREVRELDYLICHR